MHQKKDCIGRITSREYLIYLSVIASVYNVLSLTSKGPANAFLSYYVQIVTRQTISQISPAMFNA